MKIYSTIIVVTAAKYATAALLPTHKVGIGTKRYILRQQSSLPSQLTN